MKEINCFKCSTSILSTATFCHECGNKVKCQCGTFIVEGAKFCSECGMNLSVNLNESGLNRNTLSYRRKGDDIVCEVNVSDEVGKQGFQTLIQSITAPQSYQLSIPQNDVKDIDYQIDDDSKNFDKYQGGVTEPLASKSKNQQDTAITTYPHIEDILSKRSNLSEMEWVLIFCFYQSNYGKDTLDKEEVKSAYFSKRKSVSRSKNFSTNWNGVKKAFLTTISEGVYRIEFDKLEEVSDFVLGKKSGLFKGAYEGSKTKKKNNDVEKKSTGKSKSLRSVKSTKQIQLEEVDVIKTSSKPSLHDFYISKQPKSNREIFGLVAYYICVYNKQESFTVGNVDYVYRILKLGRKNNLIQQINNVKNETQWFEGQGSGIWKLTRLGEVELEKLFDR
ncbi:zinc ribbon domain-containing protein [Flavobacterium sp. NRK1]|uniref:zinc ribbon domain-containing protein n=1 Tax=Flavobacterium sp. NRK1 TaxID=2954929 RepID=UPI002093943C|nr:zinc ribbon domain-containing protein [Flavobacterium sp. NRK1]MCO6148965.1 zinc ribbon domain-containing protein [Flavobacterium sp. NRK1]